MSYESREFLSIRIGGKWQRNQACSARPARDEEPSSSVEGPTSEREGFYQKAQKYDWWYGQT